MRFTTVTLQRPEGTVLQTGIQVQVDQTGEKEAHDHTQAYLFHGGDLYKITTLWMPLVPIRRQDLLVDEQFTDEETGAPLRYRVVGRPKTYPYSHQQCYTETPVGN